MPASEVICRWCAPGGGPRSWVLRRLPQERFAAGLAPENLAARAGVSEATVRRAECGGRVRTETAAKLAEALGTGVRDLAVGKQREE